MIALYTLLAVIGGMSLAVQGPVNAGLGRKTSKYMATLISFFGGSIALGIVTLIFGSGDLRNLAGTEWWKWLGGLYGAINVCVSVAVMPILGVALSLTVNMLGQLAASFVIDSLGILEVEAVPISALRLVGILIVAVGIILIYIGNLRQNRTQNNDRENRKKKLRTTLPLMFLMFASGILGAIQTPTNKALTTRIGTFEGTFVSFIVGTLSILVVALIMGRGKFPKLKGAGIKPYQFFGGILGAIGIFLNIFTMTPLGTALQTISALIGQLIGGIIIDSTGILESEKVKLNPWRIVGVIVIAAGVVLVSIAKSM